MKVKVLSAVLSTAVISGCVSISPSDNEKLRELRSVGISEMAVKRKEPGTAGALNILPGVGNFYLAVGTNEGSQWTYGFLNLLFWPLSVVWAIPQAAVDANTINKMETIYYYNYTKEGKRQLEARKSLNNDSSSNYSPSSSGGF